MLLPVTPRPRNAWLGQSRMLWRRTRRWGRSRSIGRGPRSRWRRWGARTRPTERSSATVRRAQEAAGKTACALLAGEGDCQTCEQPLSEVERRKITISSDAQTTTIARVTCPTAPKFWRWRDIPWPKVVQRDVEFLEHADEINEWKGQLVAAILCGAFGLGAYFLRAYPWSVIGFLLAYVAGAWFTAQEVWGRLQKQAIDGRFLLLAGAAGSASIGAWGEGATLVFLFLL